MSVDRLQLAAYLRARSEDERRRVLKRLVGSKEQVCDPKWWAQPTSFQRENTNPFQYDRERFLAMALRCCPSQPLRRVSDFSKWIFSLYAPRAEPAALALGKKIEREIEREMLRFTHVAAPRGWRLLHRDPLDEAVPGKTISALQVNGAPLRGVPDVVFQNESNGEIVIVERKSSHRQIASDGWPNLRAQLWAYGKLDEYVDAPGITLVGEVWGYARGMRDRIIRKRASLMWSADDAAFDRANGELFAVYNGTYRSNRLSS